MKLRLGAKVGEVGKGNEVIDSFLVEFEVEACILESRGQVDD